MLLNINLVRSNDLNILSLYLINLSEGIFRRSSSNIPDFTLIVNFSLRHIKPLLFPYSSID